MDPELFQPSRLLFVTGRLAEFSLRRELESLAPQVGFIAEIAVLPISVAALMPPKWVARHLVVPDGVDRVILPGHCRGDLSPVVAKANGSLVELGPEDLHDLPRFFGLGERRREGFGAHDISILAEINHAPRLTLPEILAIASDYQVHGADLIDLGCDPGDSWMAVSDTVKALREAGHRVSIDSFDPIEVAAAAKAGAELVLSVNRSNREFARDWGLEVVALPDRVGSLDGLSETMEYLDQHRIPFRVDPILEPIGVGFAASLGRYLDVRKLYPNAEMMMGVGNLTELTDCDSAGINTLLIGFCQEVGIRSVLTTEVINWARTSVREIDLARRLAYHAVANRTPPKKLDPGLVMLRDPKLLPQGFEVLAELQKRIKDPNWRIFAEGGRIYAMNHDHFLNDVDPYVLFEQMEVEDASHAFYLGQELMKAKIAITLNKQYRQDNALQWGILTEPEKSHRNDAKKRMTEDSEL